MKKTDKKSNKKIEKLLQQLENELTVGTSASPSSTLTRQTLKKDIRTMISLLIYDIRNEI